MPTHYIIEADTLAGIAGAIREKTGVYSPIAVADMEAQILSITGGSGGSGSMGDHTITFMSEDGSAVLCEKPVMHGDTCGDPITLGLFDTPTKESTAQYEYTFNGWSLTASGEADSNALVNVTEDRTVYAAFKAETRAYTINFYDGETLLQTMICEYGTTPSYTPADKEGYKFAGWNPAVATVTGDADYYAEWVDALNGSCGTNATWNLSDGVLTISGTGAIDDYKVTASPSTTTVNPPWWEYREQITEVVVGDGITTIGEFFIGTPWRDIHTISDYPNLEKVTISEGVTTIKSSAFSYTTSLKEIVLPSTLTTLERYAFRGSGITSISIPNKIETIKQYSFHECRSLETLNMASNVTLIEMRAFADCDKLKNIDLSSSLVEIDWEAFRSNFALESITIPESVNMMDSDIFSNCNALTSVTFENPNGWWYASSESATSGTEIPSTELADPTTAATYLVTTYKGYTWKRT